MVDIDVMQKQLKDFEARITAIEQAIAVAIDVDSIVARITAIEQAIIAGMNTPASEPPPDKLAEISDLLQKLTSHVNNNSAAVGGLAVRLTKIEATMAQKAAKTPAKTTG